MQVIRTVDSRQTGGPEEQLLVMCPLLNQSSQVRTSILLIRSPAKARDGVTDFAHRAKAAGIPIVTLPELPRSWTGLANLPTSMNADLLHMHGQRGNFFVWSMRALFPRTWGALPLIATVHGWVQDNALRRVVTRLEQATLRDCNHVIAVSSAQRGELIHRHFNPNLISIARGAGVNTFGNLSSDERRRMRRHSRSVWGFACDDFVIASIGRLSTEKRHDLFLDVCRSVADQMPDTRFLIVGGGKQESKLTAYAQSLGLGNRVVFTGLTHDMNAVYAGIDALMICSDTEGTPIVLLEALANGIPVISTSVGGIPEIVTSGEQAILVAPGDREALCEAVQRLRRDDDLRNRLVENGLSLSSGFSRQAAVDQLIQLYTDVVQQQKRSSAP